MMNVGLMEQLDMFSSNRKPYNPMYTNRFLVSINCGLPPMSELRVTPKGQKTVPEIVKPGMIVRTNHGDGEYKVIKVHKAKSDYYPTNYWLELERDGKTGYVISEIVAEDGRLLMLFKRNPEEVFIVEEA